MCDRLVLHYLRLGTYYFGITIQVVERMTAIGRPVRLYAPKVFLARHATPDWTRRDIPYDIPPGPPLTAQGEEEARRLGDFLREQGIVKIYASPLVRTLRTAELAAEATGARLIVAHEIAEWRRDEDEPTVLSRVRDLWQRACDESEEIGPIALVTHGGCVLSMLSYLQTPVGEINHYRNQFDHRNPLPPAGAWLTRRNPGGGWEVRLQFTPQPIQPYFPEIAMV
jgi:broad specificity phosphatase PhoE